MPLNWDVSKVENHEKVCFIWSPYEANRHGGWDRISDDARRINQETGEQEVRLISPVTEALVFHTMGVKISQITEKNADEFFARVALMEKVDGAMLVDRTGPRPITIEMVRARIGLSTNAGTFTRTQWMKSFVNDRMDMLIRDLNRR